MGTENKTKINRLINQWTTGTPSATSYLGSSGFSGDLLEKYKNSGWLEPFGRGAYIRSGDKKVKRLFLYMAENQELAWLAKVDLSKVNLGKGKRMIVRKGQYDSKYQITVPVDWEK